MQLLATVVGTVSFFSLFGYNFLGQVGEMFHSILIEEWKFCWDLLLEKWWKAG